MIVIQSHFNQKIWLLSRNSIFEQIKRLITVQFIWRHPEYPPAKQRPSVILFDVTKKSLWSCVPSFRPYSSLHFEGYLMFGNSIIEPPLPHRVEHVLLYTLDTEVGLAYYRKDVRFWLFSWLLRPFLWFVGGLLICYHIV